MSRITLALALLPLTACTAHTYDQVSAQRSGTEYLAAEVNIDRAADILFVIDNSGSMAEEQENLAANASSSGDPTSPCSAEGFAALQAYLADNPELRQSDWDAEMQLIHEACGFIERLMLHDNRFHIGVISTDMHDCDMPFGSGARGSVPQRGCLQSALGDDDPVLRWDSEDLAARFAATVRGMGVYGSAIEQGLAAAEHFLTPGHDTPPAGTCQRARDCSDDLERFWRERELNACDLPQETKLVLIFLTDEEDCSHGGAIDESVSGVTEQCYTRSDELIPTSRFAQQLRGLKGRDDLVSVAVIGGLFDDGDGMQPSGCKLEGGQPTNSCDLTLGNSVATCSQCLNGQPICPCHPAIDAASCDGIAYPATNCCQADPAERYTALARAMPTHRLDTLCSTSFRDTLMAIADLANRTDVVCLDQEVDADQALIYLLRADGNELIVPPGLEQGWALLESGRCLKFSGEWVPSPGDKIEVRLPIAE